MPAAHSVPPLAPPTSVRAQHPDNQLAIEQAAAVKPLVALLSKGSASVQEEAAGALMNLAAHPDNERVIAAAGAVEPLVEMVKAGGGGAEQVHAHAHAHHARAGFRQPPWACASS